MTEFAPGGALPGDTPLAHAYRYLGVQEVSRNRGPLIDGWVARRGLDPAGKHPWCACFACAMIEDAGYDIRPSASVRRLVQLNPDRIVTDPQPGDLCIHLNADGTGHVAFFVRRLADGRIETLDGNSDNQGRREGTMVCIVARPAAYWQKFLRPSAP